MHIGAIVLALCYIGITPSYGEECGALADFVFVIDGSTSIRVKNFNKTREFIRDVISKFNVGPNDIHVAAMTFARTADIEFTFAESKNMNSEEVGNKIVDIPFPAGTATYTHLALQKLKTMFSTGAGARPDVPHICILITDGKSTDPTKTKREAKIIKDSGIKMIAIGIEKADINELKIIASEPESENAIFKNSFEELRNTDFQQGVAHKACEVVKTTTIAPPETTTTTTAEPTTTTAEPTTTTAEPTTTTTPEPTTTPLPKDEPEKECQGKEVDILFVLDMSTSIWSVDFKRQLGFVSDVIDNFDIKSGKTKVGLVSFSDKTTMAFDFNEYKTAEEIKAAVGNVKQEGGITNTHLALNTTMDMFTPKHGSRPDVAHICILITDGRSSLPKLTIPAANRVHDKGIYVFAIGVGNMTYRPELEMMASKPADKYTFEVKNGYEALPTIKKKLAYKSCKVPGDQSRCLSDSSAKIMFGLYGIGGQDRAEVFDLIKRIGGGFDLHKGEVSIGIKEVCGNSDLDMQTYESNSEFYGEMNSAMTSTISTMIVDIRNAFPKPPKKMRYTHVTILLVSGTPDDMDAAFKEVRRLRGKSVVYVVNVGGASPEIAKFADNQKTHVFSSRDPSGYAYVAKRVLNHLCEGQ